MPTLQAPAATKVTAEHLALAHAYLYLLTELRRVFPAEEGVPGRVSLRFLLMADWEEEPRDLSALTVCLVGSVVETGDPWEPWRLLDPAGVLVEPVAVFLRDLQAIGRSATTQRSYGMELLRWFRFLWAVEVGWDRATRAEARDFCCWMQDH